MQGSADGTTWKDIDRRAGETFSWDRQTRVFSVHSPGSYPHYRLVGRADGTTLAEVELLS